MAGLPVTRKNSKTAEDQNAEKTRLESRLEELLSNVEGVGEVEVIIMTGDGGNTENFSISGNNEVTGVLVAAQGAGSAVTVQNNENEMRRVEVKKIMKKNQVIITSLAILIAVAGYLNFADVDLGFKDKETSTDSSSILDDVNYDLTDETALLDENGADGTTQSEVMDTASPGEAVLTGASDFAAQAKVSREQVRSQNKADLQAIISNKDISDEEKQNAINTMVSMTDFTEKEAAAELLLEAKGFENVIVNLTGETADVVVPDADLEDAKRAQIEDIVKRKTGVAAESIVITPLSQRKNASDVINTADEAEKNTGGAEDNAESTGDEVQDTAASVESDPTDQTSEDAETAADIQNDQTIDTEGIYD